MCLNEKYALTSLIVRGYKNLSIVFMLFAFF